MRDRLNFFEPYERLSPKHENQLTRALLVLLRYCPIAHQAWLSLIGAATPPDSKLKNRLALHSLGPPTFHTQQAQILRNEDQPKTNEAITGISVLCRADASNEIRGPVLESDRGQVLDGIIIYAGDSATDPFVIVLESKLHKDNGDRQARNINFYGQPIQFDGAVLEISWRDVLAVLTDLEEKKRSVVSGAELEVLKDFLNFVNENFPRLGPYSTLGRCEGEPSRVQRRLDAINAVYR